MTDHITAAELRELSGDYEARCRIGDATLSEQFDRAAAALDAKDARIAELEEVLTAVSGFNVFQHQADAELGALVRRWRDHPERSVGSMEVADLTLGQLALFVNCLDSLAASREAEQGVEGPSGWRWRVVRTMHGDLLLEKAWEAGEWEGHCFAHYRGGCRDWREEVPPCDHAHVAALIERHGGGK